jgi:hypothetical protein
MGHADWLQAKDHEIYEVAPFYRSKLLLTDGYKLLLDGEIEKIFRNEEVLWSFSQCIANIQITFDVSP